MTRCTNCDVVDLGTKVIVVDEEEQEVCVNCGSEHTVEEIDDMDWLDEIEADIADFENELREDLED